MSDPPLSGVTPLQAVAPPLAEVTRALPLSPRDLDSFRFGPLGPLAPGWTRDNPLVPGWTPGGGSGSSHEEHMEMRKVEAALAVLTGLRALPRSGVTKAQRDLVESARATLEAFLVAGLSRMAWSRGNDDAAADAPVGAYLAGSAARVFDTLRPLYPAALRLADRPVYVCVGDKQGPGCGLVFHPRRTRNQTPTRCDRCNLKEGAPILLNPVDSPRRGDLQLDGKTPFWADRWDPSCRRVRIAVRCKGCEEWFFSAPESDTDAEKPRQQARGVKYCPSCKPNRVSTKRSRAKARTA
jgi:hypothetical protein